jgi:hypothetical protein
MFRRPNGFRNLMTNQHNSAGGALASATVPGTDKGND